MEDLFLDSLARVAMDDEYLWVYHNPVVCNMDVKQLQKCMHFFSTMLYSGLVTLDGSSPRNYVWNVDACEDLWMLNYQYFTDPALYQYSIMMVGTDFADQMIKDYKKEFNIGYYFPDDMPGGDEWFFGYLAKKLPTKTRHAIPFIPLQQEAYVDFKNFEGIEYISIEGMHGPHSFLDILSESRKFEQIHPVEGFTDLPRNGIYYISEGLNFKPALDNKSPENTYAIKDSTGTKFFKTNHWYLGSSQHSTTSDISNTAEINPKDKYRW